MSSDFTNKGSNDDEKDKVSPEAYAVDPRTIPNPVLQRLIQEVRHEKQNKVTSYNRVHNRHNRGR